MEFVVRQRKIKEEEEEEHSGWGRMKRAQKQGVGDIMGEIREKGEKRWRIKGMW